jgi:hypothetical protein
MTMAGPPWGRLGACKLEQQVYRWWSFGGVWTVLANKWDQWCKLRGGPGCWVQLLLLDRPSCGNLLLPSVERLQCKVVAVLELVTRAY